MHIATVAGLFCGLKFSYELFWMSLNDAAAPGCSTSSHSCWTHHNDIIRVRIVMCGSAKRCFKREERTNMSVRSVNENLCGLWPRYCRWLSARPLETSHTVFHTESESRTSRPAGRVRERSRNVNSNNELDEVRTSVSLQWRCVSVTPAKRKDHLELKLFCCMNVKAV